MIILDTNIISELMAADPEPNVVEWLNKQETSTLFLTTITVAEIYYGLSLLPRGKRKSFLEKQFDRFLQTAFEQRILAFDLSCTAVYGDIMAKRRRAGRPMSSLDGQIAAIALNRSFAVATRNTKDFSSCGLDLINPFD